MKWKVERLTNVLHKIYRGYCLFSYQKEKSDGIYVSKFYNKGEAFWLEKGKGGGYKLTELFSFSNSGIPGEGYILRNNLHSLFL